MKKINFTTAKEVCSSSIDIEITDDGKIHRVHFNGGCHGSLKAVSALAKNRTPQEVIAILDGITCGAKKNSCPDQLARALKKLIF